MNDHITIEVKRPEDWPKATAKMRLLTLYSEQDRQDLRRISTEVKVFGKELKLFCTALLDHMKTEQGIGLAAPQMGVFQRIFAMQINEEEAPIVAINPVIEAKVTEKVLGEEGCLSVPGIYAEVARWQQICVRAQTPYGEVFELNLEGLKAICFQHENDHLNGILFTDYLKRSQQKKILRYFDEVSQQDAP